MLLIAGAERGEGWIVTRPFRAVIGGLEREVMPPVRVQGMLPRPEEIRVLTMEPIKRQFRQIRDLLPFIGKSEAEE